MDSIESAVDQAYLQSLLEEQQSVEAEYEVDQNAEFDAFIASRLEDFDDIAEEVCQERVRQFHKWGDQDHHPDKFYRILGEEVGEIGRALNDKNLENYRVECIQVAAVALRMVQSIDRIKKENPPRYLELEAPDLD